MTGAMTTMPPITAIPAGSAFRKCRHISYARSGRIYSPSSQSRHGFVEPAALRTEQSNAEWIVTLSPSAESGNKGRRHCTVYCVVPTNSSSRQVRRCVSSVARCSVRVMRRILPIGTLTEEPRAKQARELLRLLQPVWAFGQKCAGSPGPRRPSHGSE